MTASCSVPIPVLAEHRDYFVVNKPCGINVHQQDDVDGLVTRLKKQLNTEHLWLAHRLDQVTSGCLLLARNKTTAASLGEQFQQRQVGKFYLALCYKRPKKRQGTIKGDMKKIRAGRWALSRSLDNPAVTHFYDMGLGNGLRLQLLRPHTGQTHQLRVVLNSLGSTILGDTFYGGTAADRTYLHAWQLTFEHQQSIHRFACLPASGEHFQSDLFLQKVEDISPPEDRFRWPDTRRGAGG